MKNFLFCLIFLIGFCLPISAGNPRVAKCKTIATAAQSFSASAFTAMDCGAIEYNIGDIFSVSADFDTITVNADCDIRVTVFAPVSCASGANYSIGFWLNGSRRSEGCYFGTVGSGVYNSTTRIIHVSSGTQIKGFVYCTGTNPTTDYGNSATYAFYAFIQVEVQ